MKKILFVTCLIFLSYFQTSYASDETVQNQQITLKKLTSFTQGNISSIEKLFTFGDRVLAVARSSDRTHLLTFKLNESNEIQLVTQSSFENIGDIFDFSPDGEWMAYENLEEHGAQKRDLNFLHWNSSSLQWQYSFSVPNVLRKGLYTDFDQSQVLFSDKGNFITVLHEVFSQESEVAIYRFDVDTKSLTHTQTIFASDNEFLDEVLFVYLDEQDSALIFKNEYNIVVFPVDLLDFQLGIPFSSDDSEFAFYNEYDAKNNRILSGSTGLPFLYRRIDFENRQVLTLSEVSLYYKVEVKLKDNLISYSSRGHHFPINSSVSQIVNGEQVVIKTFSPAANHFAITDSAVWVQEQGSLSVFNINRSQDVWSLDLIDILVDGEQTLPYFNGDELFDEENDLAYRVSNVGLSVYNIANDSLTFSSWQELGFSLEDYDLKLEVINNNIVIFVNGSNFILLPSFDDQGNIVIDKVLLSSEVHYSRCDLGRVSSNSPLFSAYCYAEVGGYNRVIFKMQESSKVNSLIINMDIFLHDDITSYRVEDIFNHSVVFSLTTREGTYTDEMVHLSVENNGIQVQAAEKIDTWEFESDKRFIVDDKLLQLQVTNNSIIVYQLHNSGRVQKLSEYMLDNDTQLKQWREGLAYIDKYHLVIPGFEQIDNNASSQAKLFRLDPETFVLSETDLTEDMPHSYFASFIQTLSSVSKNKLLFLNDSGLEVFKIGHSPSINNLPEQIVLNEGADDVPLVNWIVDEDEGDTLTYSSTNNPTGITLTDDGYIKFDTLEKSSGIFEVKVEDSFKLTLEFSVNYFFNFKPVLQAIPSIHVQAGEAINSRLEQFASDAENQQLSFHSDNLVTGLKLSSDGQLTGKIQSDGNYTFELVVTDSLGNSTSQNVGIVVQNRSSGGVTFYFIFLIFVLLYRALETATLNKKCKLVMRIDA